MKQIKAVAHNILCFYEPQGKERKTKSGVIIPEGIKVDYGDTNMPQLFISLKVHSVGKSALGVEAGDEIIVDRRLVVPTNPDDMVTIIVPNPNPKNDSEKYLIPLSEGHVKAIIQDDGENDEEQSETESDNGE